MRDYILERLSLARELGSAPKYTRAGSRARTERPDEVIGIDRCDTGIVSVPAAPITIRAPPGVVTRSRFPSTEGKRSGHRY
jgi:hypothetical protein